MNKTTFIRSTFHYFRRDTNIGKLPILEEFVKEYRSAVKLCVNHIWNLKIEWKKGRIWDREKDLLDCPSMISTTGLDYRGPLSSRALKCAATQACGIVQAVVNKRKKDLRKVAWLKSINKIPSKGLQKRLDQGMTKPECESINCELNSICADIKFENGKRFDGFIQLKCLWNRSSKYSRGLHIRIPVKHYRRSLKWKKVGTLLNSIHLNEASATLRWEVSRPHQVKTGRTIAIDQGKTDCLTTSDKQEFKKDIHGHTLESIIRKLANKKWGSDNFWKVAEHRKNHINWFVNQLNLTDVKEIKLEDIYNINYGRNVSRELKHWTNTQIREAICKLSEEAGVLFTLEENAFNSQRCNSCGWVQKSNRSGKKFKCKKCGHEEDSDFNASQNILIRDTLVKLPFGFRRHHLNLKGFYWTSTGLFDALRQELTVPVIPENQLVHT